MRVLVFPPTRKGIFSQLYIGVRRIEDDIEDDMPVYILRFFNGSLQVINKSDVHKILCDE